MRTFLKTIGILTALLAFVTATIALFTEVLKYYRELPTPTIAPQPITSTPLLKLAFDSNREGNFEIYTMNGNGAGQTRLTNNMADDERPSWSPDGKQIASRSNR